MAEPMSEERLSEIEANVSKADWFVFKGATQDLLAEVRSRRVQLTTLCQIAESQREEARLMSADIQGLEAKNRDLLIALQGAESFRRAAWREALKNGANIDSLAQALLLASLSAEGRRHVLGDAEAEGYTVLGMASEGVRKAFQRAARALIRDAAKDA